MFLLSVLDSNFSYRLITLYNNESLTLTIESLTFIIKKQNILIL
jgi:hypothetical protein